MHRLPVLFLLTLLLCACTSNFERAMARWELLAAEPTPAEWTPGSTWTFEIDGGRDAPKRLQFHVTDTPADSCTSGQWFKLELLEGELGGWADVPFEAAYSVEGRNLLIGLAANWCDVDLDLKGELQGAHFSGRYTSGGPMGSSEPVPVRGWQVR